MDGGGGGGRGRGCDAAARTKKKKKKKRNDYPRVSFHIKRGGRVFRQMRKGSVSVTHLIISSNQFQGGRVIYAGIKEQLGVELQMNTLSDFSDYKGWLDWIGSAADFGLTA